MGQPTPVATRSNVKAQGARIRDGLDYVLYSEFCAKHDRPPRRDELDALRAEREQREAKDDERRAADAERRRRIAAGEDAPFLSSDPPGAGNKHKPASEGTRWQNWTPPRPDPATLGRV